jgi:hypothetical protein
MNALRYWQRRDDAYTLYRLRDEITAITPRVFYPYGAINFFIPTLGVRILRANSCPRWRGIFKGLSQEGGRNNFSENLHASPFTKDLSNKATFARSISLGSTFNMEESGPDFIPDIKYVEELFEICL